MDTAHPMALGTRMDDLTTLARDSLLRGLGMRDLGALIEKLDLIAVPAGLAVQSQGTPSEHLFFVLEGTAEAQRSGVTLAALAPGDHFGELALLGAKADLAVRATTPMRLARLSRARFDSLASNHPTVALHLLRAVLAAVGARLDAMTESVGLLLGQRSLPRRSRVSVTRNGHEESVATGTVARSLLPVEKGGAPVVGALLDRKPVSLEMPIVSDAELEPLTMATPEGREVYRRSAGLLLLEAAARVAPRAPVRLGSPCGTGRVVHAPRELLDPIARTMRAIVTEAAPFREELWTVEEARGHLAEQGWKDAATLLDAWRDPAVTLASCGRVYALGMGPFLPSTGALAAFELAPHPDGFVLELGARSVSGRSPQCHGGMAQAHRRWLSEMGVDSVGAFNAFCVSGKVAELVRVSEGFHEKRIGQIADAIAARGRGVRVIAVAGPSSSGKTTFLKRLMVQLEIDGLHPVNVSLDDYYIDREKTPRDASGEYDFEAFEAIDRALLQDHVARLLRGEAVKTARFDFLTGKSLPDGGPLLRVGPSDVLMVEGIHGLNPALLGDATRRDERFAIFLNPALALPFDSLTSVSPSDVRLLRRIVRDRHQRGYKAHENIARWASVRRGEEAHILPFQGDADAEFDSSLAYEIAVLRVFADRYLLEVPREHPEYATSFRLRTLLDRFVTIYPDHVPPTSIVREFIGGSGFEY